MKRTTFRKSTMTLAVATALYGSAACALPTGLGATQGVAGISTAGPVMTVTTQAGKSIANWQSFSIGAGEKVIINQPGATSAILNRVTGADPSAILGQLQSNGRVWLVNPAGIMVSHGARIDTAAFVASTLAVKDSDFLAGRLNFGGDAAAKSAGRITNDGEIRTPAGGSILIVAPQIENNGVMTSPSGEIILAAGHTVQVLDTGTPGVSVEVKADRGELNLSQMIASGHVFARNSGTISASNVVAEGGRVFLRASPADGGVAVNTGTLEAEGATGKGGFIDTSGTYLELNEGRIMPGSGGMLLIDPMDLVIGTRGVTVVPPDASLLDADLLSNLLNTGNYPVEITTLPEANITVVSRVYATGSQYLGLHAGRDIILDGTNGNTGSIWLPNTSLTLHAGGSIRQLVDTQRRYAMAENDHGSINTRWLYASAGGDIDLFHSGNRIVGAAMRAGGSLAMGMTQTDDVIQGTVTAYGLGTVTNISSGSGNVTLHYWGRDVPPPPPPPPPTKPSFNWNPAPVLVAMGQAASGPDIHPNRTPAAELCLQGIAAPTPPGTWTFGPANRSGDCR